ncbi:methyl-accepting chemotaxis protein, partial [bacterium]|nr:methyl-accepting chemotaxis protein [bacterium]
MKMWNDLKVRAKLMVMVCGVCVALLAVGGVGLGNMRGLAGHMGELNTGIGHVAQVTEMKSTFLQMRLSLVYMLALTDAAKITQKGEEFEKCASLIKESINEILKSDVTEAEKAQIAEFRSGFEAYMAGGTKLAEMARSAAASGNPAARVEATAFATGSVAPLYDKPAKVISSLVEANLKGSRQMYENDMASYRRALAVTAVVMI